MPRWIFFVAGFALLGALGVFAVSRVTPRGIEAIKREEGFRAKPYRDKAGHPTIGYGHKIRPGEVFTEITKEQGEQLLLADLAEAEGAVQRLVKVPLTPGQYDALVSLVFNIGVGAFEYGGPNKTHSTILKRLNAGDYQGARAELARWNKITVDGEKVPDPVLTARRAREQDIFIS